MASVLEATLARGWYESRGVRHAITNPAAFRAEHGPLIRDSRGLMHKRGTLGPFEAFLARRRLEGEMNVTMFSAFCSCEKDRLESAIALLEDRLDKGEQIQKPLACLITLTRAIEHKFLRGRDKYTYETLRGSAGPRRTW